MLGLPEDHLQDSWIISGSTKSFFFLSFVLNSDGSVLTVDGKKFLLGLPEDLFQDCWIISGSTKSFFFVSFVLNSDWSVLTVDDKKFLLGLPEDLLQDCRIISGSTKSFFSVSFVLNSDWSVLTVKLSNQAVLLFRWVVDNTLTILCKTWCGARKRLDKQYPYLDSLHQRAKN